MTSNSLARIGESHGYLIAGDAAQLNAELHFSEALPATDHWALQLWASADGFAQRRVAGVKVAELPVYPVAGRVDVAAEVLAMPPAGTAAQQMALALVRWSADGSAETADLAVFARPESFIQPRLSGEVHCALADGFASLAVAAIENPRSADNLSGTLSLEVWALDEPYAGGSWQGAPVASVVVGVVAGGCAATDCAYRVPAAVPAGQAALTVMLREWTPAGYVTRDYRNLAPAAAPVVAEAVAAKPTAVAAKPATKAAKPVAKAAKAEAAPAKPEKAEAAGQGVSINKASAAELQGVKGITAALAKAIIASRPYKTLDELSRAKGVGPKLLAKLRDFLTL